MRENPEFAADPASQAALSASRQLAADQEASSPSVSVSGGRKRAGGHRQPCQRTDSGEQGQLSAGSYRELPRSFTQTLTNLFFYEIGSDHETRSPRRGDWMYRPAYENMAHVRSWHGID